MSEQAIELASERLATEEGFRALPYTDTQGHTTIGFGFNVDAGISRSAAGALLTAQLDELDGELFSYAWYQTLDPARQSVCLDIAFNAGLSGLLHYPKMIAALQAGDWAGAAAQCTTSTPGLQARYAQLAKILLTGACP